MMQRRLALKRLTRSDLTIFEAQYTRIGAGNQKSINLNANIFINAFYPNLDEIAEERGDWRFLLNLTILGPGTGAQIVLPQKILKGGTYKNWRLNGKLIPNPEGSLRFDSLQEGDFAILEFTGAAFPTGVRMILIAAGNHADASLHDKLHEQNEGKSMVVLGPEALEAAIDSCRDDLPQDHPALDFLDSTDLEDAALNGETGRARLRRRRRSRGVSHDELQRARRQAESVGRLGETLLDGHLSREHRNKEIASYHWDAAENAVSPFDFTIVRHNGERRVIDAKTTAGPFETPIHVSLGELMEMAEGEAEYDIYRLYEAASNFARVRVAESMRDFATAVLQEMESIREGVRVDSVSIEPQALSFSKEFVIDLSDDDEPE